MSTQFDFDQLLDSWLADGPSELPERAVARIVQAIDDRRRPSWLPRRETMNRYLIAAGSLAAVVLVAVIGFGLVNGGVFGPGASPTPSPTPSAPPAPTPAEGYKPFVLFRDATGTITLTIPDQDWDGDEGNALLLSTTKANTGLMPFVGDLWIYGDPCAWSTTTPDAPATTADEIVAALGAQASRDASEPSAITMGGHAGQSITLHVPEEGDIAFVPPQDGDAGFSDCDAGYFGTLTNGVGGDPRPEPERHAQGPSQIDEFWVADVDGVPVLFDLFYWPDTPQDVIDELHAMAESATFGR